jgi:NAD(P)-dependent dehydrogenase (short-subunit alcohol dehydrogenase family)
MPKDFQGKVVIVTGGASGIGRAAALELGKLGARVAVVTGRKISAGEETARLIREAGGDAVFIQCDVSSEEQVKTMVAETVVHFGRLDGAFNNAGVGPDGVRYPYGPLTELSEENWDSIMNVNLKGVFLCMKHEIRQLLKQGRGGAIVNTSSVGGIKMAPGFGAYGPSKAGVIAVSRTAAIENAKAGIRVNIVCPGPTLGTDLMTNTLSVQREEENLLKEHVIPMGKLGDVADVVHAAVWLLSDIAGHITGQIISVDGGMANL